MTSVAEKDRISVRYVRVRLSDAERTVQWREVDADSLEAAVKVAEQMEDVEVCLEAKLEPPVCGWYSVSKNPGQIVQVAGDLTAMGGIGQQGDPA